MFKVGDWVCLNPKYLKRPDIVRGIITAKQWDGEKDTHIIDWEDGKEGNSSLYSQFLIKV